MICLVVNQQTAKLQPQIYLCK